MAAMARSGDRLRRYVNSKWEWNGVSITEFFQGISVNNYIVGAGYA